MNQSNTGLAGADPSDDRELPMEVLVGEEGHITISWDANHPVTSAFNEWGEEDFIEAIRNQVTKALKNKDSKVTE